MQVVFARHSSRYGARMVFFVYLLIINLVTFGAFGADKNAARKGEWRTPERRLWLLCALGGTPGALLAMRIFRHKRRKSEFVTVVWLIVAPQAALTGFVLLR